MKFENSRPRCTTALAAIAMAMATGGCLPQTLSEAELAERIAQATFDSAAQGDSVTGNLCGNGQMDPGSGEACDSGSDLCSDCSETCELRRVFAVDKDEPRVDTEASDKLDFSPDRDINYSIWFRQDQMQPVGTIRFLMARSELRAGELLDSQVELSIGLDRAGIATGARPFCSVRVQTNGVVGGQGKNLVAVAVAKSGAKVGAWHHLRCYYSQDTKLLSLSVDGNSPDSTAVDPKLALPWPSQTVLSLGALPSVDDSDLFFEGQLDELGISSVVPANAWRVVERRIEDPASMIALYHMDLDADESSLVDSAANPAPAESIGDASLAWAPEGCYGQSAASASCSDGAAPALWCTP